MKVNIEGRNDGTFIAYNTDGIGTIIGTGANIPECKDDFLNSIEEVKHSYEGGESYPPCYDEVIEFLLIEDDNSTTLRERKIQYLKDFFKSCGSSWADSCVSNATYSYEEYGHDEWLEKIENDEHPNLTEKTFKKKWIKEYAMDNFGDQSGESINEISFRELDLDLFSDDLAQAAKDNFAYEEILRIWREGYKGWGWISARSNDGSTLNYNEGSLFWHIVGYYFEHEEYYDFIDDGCSEYFRNFN